MEDQTYPLDTKDDYTCCDFTNEIRRKIVTSCIEKAEDATQWYSDDKPYYELAIKAATKIKCGCTK